MKAFAGEWFAWLFVVALLFVLVRPKSSAAQFVDSFTDAMASMVRTATNL